MHKSSLLVHTLIYYYTIITLVVLLSYTIVLVKKYNKYKIVRSNSKSYEIWFKEISN